MKKNIITVLLLAGIATTYAQTRKDVANFSLFQQYFNPALTGYEGSMIKTFYRDQWSGFEHAPRTLFISGELDLDALGGGEGETPVGARHAVGISYLHDTFGPMIESQLYLNYASRVQLTETLSLRAGGALTYNAQRIDGDKIILEQQNDASLQEFMNRNSSAGRVDFNLGVILTGENFYAGYALNDAARGGLTTGQDFMEDQRNHQHIIQAGYRRGVSEQVGLIANMLMRYDSNNGETLEGQVKGVFYNTAWFGVGYRQNLAYSINLGLCYQQFRVSYARELPTGKAHNISSGTNEIVLTYNLFQIRPASPRQVMMW